EVHAQRKAVQLDQQVLAPAADRADPLAAQALDVDLAAVAFHGDDGAADERLRLVAQDDQAGAFGHGGDFRRDDIPGTTKRCRQLQGWKPLLRGSGPQLMAICIRFDPIQGLARRFCRLLTLVLWPSAVQTRIRTRWSWTKES